MGLGAKTALGLSGLGASAATNLIKRDDYNGKRRIATMTLLLVPNACCGDLHTVRGPGSLPEEKN